jgi:hypothetical protein
MEGGMNENSGKGGCSRESKTKQIIYKRKGLKRERESSNVFYLLKIR